MIALAPRDRFMRVPTVPRSRSCRNRRVVVARGRRIAVVDALLVGGQKALVWFF